jgi:cytochrome bd-type quinol oxidase subunit 2
LKKRRHRIMVVMFSFVLFFVVLGAGLVSLVYLLTKKKQHRRLTFVFVLILPASVFLAAHMLYCPTCPYNPNAAVYETSEQGKTVVWERGLPIVNRYEWGWRLHRHQLSCTQPILRISLRFSESKEKAGRSD